MWAARRTSQTRSRLIDTRVTYLAMTELLHRWSTDDVGIVATNTIPSAVVVTDALRHNVRVLDIHTGAELFPPVSVGFKAGDIYALDTPNHLGVTEAHRWDNTVAVDLMTGWIRARPKPAPTMSAPVPQFSAALGEIVDWAYDPVRDQICGINHEHSAFFIPGAGRSADYQRVPMAPFDTFNSLELYPEHRLMLATCVGDFDNVYIDGVAVYLWNLDQPERHVRIAPESVCEDIRNLRVDLSPDGKLVLIQADGLPSLHRTSDGGWIGNVDPAKGKPQWAAEYDEPFWPFRYFIRRDSGHIVALFRRCAQILDCSTGAVVAQTPPLRGRQRYTEGWIDDKNEHLILTRRFGDWFDHPKNRLDVFDLPHDAD